MPGRARLVCEPLLGAARHRSATVHVSHPTTPLPSPAPACSKLRVAISLGGSDAFRPIQLGCGGDYWVVAAGQSVDPADRSGNLYGESGQCAAGQSGSRRQKGPAAPGPLAPPLHGPWSSPTARAPTFPCINSPRPRPCPDLRADWAIVTGGRPTRRSGDACATGSRFGLVRRYQTNNVGLWLFTRKPVDPANTQVGWPAGVPGMCRRMKRDGGSWGPPCCCPR